MSKGNRFTEEFKLEAVKQVVERGLLILKSYNKHQWFWVEFNRSLMASADDRMG